MHALRFRHHVVPLGLLLLIGCRTNETNVARDPLLRRAPLQLGPVTTLSMPALAEVSGTVRDPTIDSRIWMINDGGNPAELLAVTAAGEVQQRVQVRGARNVDWEELTIGPCGTTTCLYVADVGDNDARRAFVTVYRTPLPAVGATAVDAVRLDVQWPGGPDDVEAAAMDRFGSLWFVTKGRADGRQQLMDVPASAWESASCRSTIATPCRQGPFTATLRQTLTAPVRSTQDWITGAALRGDGRLLALRTYADVLLLPVTAARTLDEAGGVRCTLEGAQRQGEALTWLTNDQLLLTTEGGPFTPASQRVVRCPLPDLR